MLDIGAHIGGYCVVLGKKIPVAANGAYARYSCHIK